MPALSYLVSIFYAAALVLGSPLIKAGQHDKRFAQDVAYQNLKARGGSIDTIFNARAASRKPFYAIAHRVNDKDALQLALNDGANAIEMDLFAETTGWWASHDGPSKNGDTARDMFNAVARHRKGGKPITFVWLDIKNPDRCDPDDQTWRFCSIAALQDLAREILEPQGVRVLFGFYHTENGNAYRLIRDDLNSKEAINVDGRAAPLLEEFTVNGPADVRKRVLSYGDPDIGYLFGNCSEPGDAHLTCTQLRQAAASGAFGKTFGWTAAAGQTQYVEALLRVGVDGVIYGLRGADYDGSAAQAAKEIRNSLEKYSDRYYLAGKDDNPW
ncbi:hypothetical protein BFJ63_vAg17577 [Fusarium oxysporum f. sp. narcissi]|uniref:Phospholipase D n=1 Tax=Fusarium oxysporum f. sp. narcissi TaxID=451672 RepID=A0A4Q2UYJ6_FUSOX|nr:hypothetical protein BFJ63_vAg17577 [Fusarium oxysporum f. sp. narcissi]